jgi:hypothetical protein
MRRRFIGPVLAGLDCVGAYMSAWLIWGLISVIAVIPVCAFFKGAGEQNDFDDRDP